jgi:HSP20 family protein
MNGSNFPYLRGGEKEINMTHFRTKINFDSLLPQLFDEAQDSVFIATESLFDRTMRDIFPDAHKQLGGCSLVTKGAYPKCNALSLDKEFRIEAAVPGLTREDITIETKETDKGIVFTISGDKQEEDELGDIRTNFYLFHELKKSKFSRTFLIHDKEKVDLDKIDAELVNGILTISIPKTEAEIKKNEINTINIK